MLLSKLAIRRLVRLLCLLGLLLLSGTRARAIIYYVSPTGNDAHSGKSWATAKATVSAANGLTTPSDQIWVAAGKYTLAASINLNSGVALYGGFDGTETALSQRNYVQNVTILDGKLKVTQIVTPAQASIRTRVDGFTFQNAFQNDFVANGSVTLANNTFIETGNNHIQACIYLPLTRHQSAVVLDNHISGAPVGNAVAGIGLDVSDDGTCSYTLIGNTVSGSGGAGMNLLTNTAVVRGNTVTDCGQGLLISNARGGICLWIITQNSVQDNGGLGMYAYATPGSLGSVVADNTITSNEGGGLACSGPLVIKDNLIANNSTGSNGGGLSLMGNFGGWTVANNTIVDNAAGGTTDGGGIYIASLSSSSTYNIANNLVAFNSSGIDTDGSTTAGLALFTNDVYASDYNNYDGLQPGPTDISLDPLFVDHINRNYHLTADSPCIDAGTDSFVAPGDTDLDGNPRIYGAHVDIGCYEWTPAAYPDLASLVVSPATLYGGQSASVLVTLTSAAPPGGATVQLSSSNPAVIAVPATVTVPAGSTFATLTVPAAPFAVPKTVVLSASYLTTTQSVTVTVNPLLASLTFAPSVVIGGANATGTITLNGPITSALTVTLSSSDPSVTVPASINIPAGATSVTFTATTTSVTAVKSVTLSATDGVRILNTTLFVDPSATLKNLVLSPTAITGGLTATGVVTLTAAAPAGGVVIPITNSAPRAAFAPATVTVAAGERSVAFQLPTDVVSTSAAVTLTAALGAVTKTAKLTVAPATIATLTLVPSTVEGSENSIGIVMLAMPAASPVTVTLAGSGVANPDVTSIVIPTGAIQATFNISTVTVTAQTTATIKATVYGVAKKATLTVTP